MNPKYYGLKPFLWSTRVITWLTVLKHEKKSTITIEINENSQEFLVVTSFFSQYQVKVLKIVKSFLFEAIFNKVFDNIAFFYSDSEEVMQVIKDAAGFLTRKVKLMEQVRVNSNCCVVCAVRMEGVNSVGPGYLQSSVDGAVVPAYVVWYNSWKFYTLNKVFTVN